ncbi:MAG TPA: 3-dehydroquinate synthase, partial [Limnochordales bacterium]
PWVVATGGGVLERPANRELLQRLGPWVWLFVDLERARARCLAQPGVRPLWQAQGAQELERRFWRRQWLYARSGIWVDTRYQTPAELADRIVQALQQTPDGLVAGWVLGGHDSHPILAGPGLAGRAGELADRCRLGETVLVVADAAVASTTGLAVEQALIGTGRRARLVAAGPGERAKSMASWMGLYDRALEAGLDRAGAVVCVGGGAVLDAGGFVAATYMRGVPWMAVPTTLLGQVDAAIGGKTAVNHPRAKNAVGAFHLPRLVAADTAALDTLPAAELRSGLAEVIKHGLVGDCELLQALEDALQAAAPGGGPVRGMLLREMVRDGSLAGWAARVKAVVVSEDPRERGRRAILNFGHTTAHALEAALGFRRIRHGEAVAVGMVTALELSRRVGILEEEGLQERLAALLRRLGLGAVRPGWPEPERLWEFMAHDKKNLSGRRRWVLLRRAGEPEVVAGAVDFPLFREVWEHQRRAWAEEGAGA